MIASSGFSFAAWNLHLPGTESLPSGGLNLAFTSLQLCLDEKGFERLHIAHSLSQFKTPERERQAILCRQKLYTLDGLYYCMLS
jgi:hypothetical protein